MDQCYEYDVETFERKGIVLPATNFKGYLAEHLTLKRYYKRKSDLAALLRSGRAAISLPEDAGSFMSIEKKPVARSREGAPLIRELVEEMLSKRTFILYEDLAAAAMCPLRIMIVPYVKMSEMAAIYRACGYTTQSQEKIEKITSFQVLSSTTKMGCFSFNLPGGPIKSLGTCPAASLGFMYETRDELLRQQDGKLSGLAIDPCSFICNGCYAIKGNYMYASMILAQQCRLMFVRKLLSNDGHPAGGKVPRQLLLIPFDSTDSLYRDAVKEHGVRKDALTVEQLLATAERTRAIIEYDHGFVDTMKAAIGMSIFKLDDRRRVLRDFGFTAAEYGLVQGFRERVHSAKSVRKREREAGVPKEKLTPVPRRAEDEKFSWQLPDPRYFRIHDAGDFFRDEYLRAWLRICRDMPDVRFWAPTRAWAKRGALHPETLALVPPNLAIRPSTLHFRSPGPAPEDLEAMGYPLYRSGKGGGVVRGERGDEGGGVSGLFLVSSLSALVKRRGRAHHGSPGTWGRGHVRARERPAGRATSEGHGRVPGVLAET